MYCTIYFLISFISLSHEATVKWLPDTSFDLPINFKNGKLPCSRQSVVFPDRLMGPVRIKSDPMVSSFLLPIDGEILLDGSITFGDGGEADCERGNVYYMEKSKTSWTQADVWSSDKFNKATPDTERVPCYDDAVEFPANIQSIVILPEFSQSVRDIQIGNEHYDTEAFVRRIFTQRDQSLQFAFNMHNTIHVINDVTCQSVSGCPCQRNLWPTDCSTKYCKPPTCVHPIKPFGHCCKICGGYVLFNVSETFDMEAFKELVEETVKSYGEDQLEYHVGRLPKNNVQLVIVDKAEYEGTSAQVLNAIDYRMQGHWVEGRKYVQLSGSPLYKAGMGGKIFVSMFFVVAISIGTIYLYYYKLPDVRYPIMGRLPSFFSRLQRRTDSVVSLTRRDSVITSTGVRTAFRNPLYDSKRGRVQVEETDTEQ